MLQWMLNRQYKICFFNSHIILDLSIKKFTFFYYDDIIFLFNIIRTINKQFYIYVKSRIIINLPLKK